MPCQCKNCEATFYITKHIAQKALNPLNHEKRDFCSHECHNKHQRKKRVKTTCAQCGKNITKTLKDYKKTKNSFCSSSCAAIFNNKARPRKLKTIKIKKIKKNKPKKNRFSIAALTKEELFKRRKNWQSARSSITNLARKIYAKSNKPKCCSKCGYDKHYQIAHIKGVSEFSNKATVEEINNIDNLVALCPNCHWEFDNISKNE